MRHGAHIAPRVILLLLLQPALPVQHCTRDILVLQLISVSVFILFCSQNFYFILFSFSFLDQ